MYELEHWRPENEVTTIAEMAAVGRQAEGSPRRVRSTWARVTLRTLRLTPVVVSLAACGAGEAAPASLTGARQKGGNTLPAATASARVPTSPLFPVAVGDTWTYSDDTRAIPPGSTRTTAITSVTLAADGSLSAEATLTDMFFSVSTTAATYTVALDGSVREATSRSSAFLLFPAASVIESGQTVPVGIGAIGPDEIGDTSPATVTAHGAGMQAITVPAGSFTARIFVVDSAVQIPALPGTGKPPGIVRTETTYWLVDAVGIVQMVTIGPQCGAPCTETSRLLRYHVGQSS